MGYRMCDNPVRDCMALADANSEDCEHYKECMVWYVTEDGEMTRLLKMGEYKKGGKYEKYWKGEVNDFNPRTGEKR